MKAMIDSERPKLQPLCYRSTYCGDQWAQDCLARLTIDKIARPESFIRAEIAQNFSDIYRGRKPDVFSVDGVDYTDEFNRIRRLQLKTCAEQLKETIGNDKIAGMVITGGGGQDEELVSTLEEASRPMMIDGAIPYVVEPPSTE
jgi:hypothetical protein